MMSGDSWVRISEENSGWVYLHTAIPQLGPLVHLIFRALVKEFRSSLRLMTGFPRKSLSKSLP